MSKTTKFNYIFIQKYYIRPNQLLPTKLDLQGEKVLEFHNGEFQTAGEHQIAIDVLAYLERDVYILQIATAEGTINIKATK